MIKPPLLLTLVVSFLFYAFYGLGSKDAPQTFEKFTPKSNSRYIRFDFQKREHIDKLCYYVGIDKNAKFRLGYSKGEGKWQKFYQYDKSFPFSFRWNCEKVNIQTDKIGILVSKGEINLGELRFMEGNRTIPYRTTAKISMMNQI